MVEKIIPEKYGQLIELDIEEAVVCSIRKHPIALFSIYFVGTIVTLCIVLGGAFLSSSLLDEFVRTGPTTAIRAVIYIVMAILVFMVLGFTWLAAYIQERNIIIVTSDKIIQILHSNIVDRKVSQISLGEVQDVTVNQTGFLSRIFGYGTLTIETSGEQNNFIFPYVPYPYQCAKEIVSARETSVKKYGN